MSIFEQATQAHLRFKTDKGTLVVEDLWDLSLTALDTIGRDLHRQIQETEVSFISEVSADNKLLQLKLDVVKRVIEVKLAKKAETTARAELIERRRLLQEALHAKKNEALQNMSVEELEKQLKELSA